MIQIQVEVGGGVYNYGYQHRIPVCFKRPSKGTWGPKPDVCRTKNGAEYGYENHIEPASIDYASLEFVPNYLIWRIGYYIFLTQRKFNFTVVDYPTKNEELSGKLDAAIFMVPFFITAGDKNLGKDGDFSFRFGVGPSITYLNEFYLENDKGSIEKSGILNMGEGGLITSTTVLFEITYNYFSYKFHTSKYRIKIEGDDYFKDDVLDFTTADSSIGFYFYF